MDQPRPPELLTPRLRLRRWRESDIEAFTEMNQDPRVMEHFPKTFDRTETEAAVNRIEAGFEKNGFGIWAMEILGGPSFVGFTGLAIPTFETTFTPCVEVGWRLAYPYWGKGYVTEAAQRALKFAFQDLRLPEIVSFTVPANLRSRAVMERIGMTRNPNEDFDHPKMPDGHPLKKHVLYRMSCDVYLHRLKKEET